MIDLSEIAKIDKNQLASDGIFLVLLKIDVPGLDVPICLVRNTEDIEWQSQRWIAFPFELGEIEEDSQGSLPSVQLRVSNVSRAMQAYIEGGSGGVNSEVTLYVVHSKNLASPLAEVEEFFSVTNTTATAEWVTFTLGTSYPAGSRRPFWRYMKNHCPFKYKSIECGSLSSLPTCPKTLTGCRERNNSVRFGGEPAIPQGGIYL